MSRRCKRSRTSLSSWVAIWSKASPTGHCRQWGPSRFALRSTWRGSSNPAPWKNCLRCQCSKTRQSSISLKSGSVPQCGTWRSWRIWRILSLYRCTLLPLKSGLGWPSVLIRWSAKLTTKTRCSSRRKWRRQSHSAQRIWTSMESQMQLTNIYRISNWLIFLKNRSSAKILSQWGLIQNRSSGQSATRILASTPSFLRRQRRLEQARKTFAIVRTQQHWLSLHHSTSGWACKRWSALKCVSMSRHHHSLRRFWHKVRTKFRWLSIQRRARRSRADIQRWMRVALRKRSWGATRTYSLQMSCKRRPATSITGRWRRWHQAFTGAIGRWLAAALSQRRRGP